MQNSAEFSLVFLSIKAKIAILTHQYICKSCHFCHFMKEYTSNKRVIQSS